MKKEEPLCPCCRREFVPMSVLKDEGANSDTGVENAPPPSAPADEDNSGDSESGTAGGG